MKNLDKDNQRLNIILKWTNRIICSILLGAIAIVIIVFIFILISWVKTPPPDIEDVKMLLTILLPVFSSVLGIIAAGLSYTGSKSHKELKEEKKVS